MQVKHEHISYGKNQKVWAGKYANSQNLPHWHYDCELVYAERGNFEIMCERQKYAVPEGCAFFIDSEQLHYISARTPDCLLTTLFFAYDIIKPFAQDFMLSEPLLSHDYGIPSTYEALIREFKTKPAFYETQLQLTVSSLLLAIFRNERISPRRISGKTSESFKNLLARIDDDYEFFTFESAADFMGMNPSYFSRFFHNLAGMPFSRYLNFIKVDKAINMLHSEKNVSVTEISVQCGFPTIRSFNRVFKQMTGYSPTNIPKDFILDEAFSRSGSADGNPTLSGCYLVESSD